MTRLIFQDPAGRQYESGRYTVVMVREHEAFGKEPDGTLSVVAFRNNDGWWMPVGCQPHAAFPDVVVESDPLAVQIETTAFLEAGVRGQPGVYPGWVYEARDAIRRQNENPPPWLPDLLAALGWQGGTVHEAMTAVRRLVAAEKERRRG